MLRPLVDGVARRAEAGLFAVVCSVFLTSQAPAQNYNINVASDFSYMATLYFDTYGAADVLTVRPGTYQLTSAVNINGNMTIEGNGAVIDMQNIDRAFFVAGGVLTLSNLTIVNGFAGGGNGASGGGGGGGLGGAIFVGSGTYPQYAAGSGQSGPVIGVPSPSIILNNVYFVNSTAQGGGGATGYAGGGGGMGGNGGSSATDGYGDIAGGGGGGFGVGANGGSGIANENWQGSNPGLPGSFFPDLFHDTYAGEGGDDGGAGAPWGGGGGSGLSAADFQPGGGGGVGGVNGNTNGAAGDGGFGGGGGGGGGAGDGGFGGGGGGAHNGPGGFGGWGGGGGGQSVNANNGGWGGGDGVAGGGGGGLGAGGAVFVMPGATASFNYTAATDANGNAAFSGNTAVGGSGAEANHGNDGSAYGQAIFVSGNVNFQTSASAPLTLQDVSDGSANGSGFQGNMTVGGTGDVNFTGGVQIGGTLELGNSGTVTLAADATYATGNNFGIGQVGSTLAPTTVIASSNVTLTAGSGLIFLGGGGVAASTLQIGSGTGTQGAWVGASVIKGDPRSRLVFSQNFACGSTTDTTYAFLSSIDGFITVVQDGPGVTVLNPIYGGGSYFTGGSLVYDGTLLIQAANAAGTAGFTVYGGTLAVAQNLALPNEIHITDGVYAKYQAAGEAYADAGVATSGFANGQTTGAALLAGTASNPTTLVTSFAESAIATNDFLRRTDVCNLQGTGTDIFTLQLSFTATAPDSYLAWLSGNEWINAVDGNSGNNATLAQQGFLGSFAAFQAIYGTDLSLYLGAWGVDSTDGTTATWAVLNHNSDFAVLPEPGTLALLGVGLSGLLVFRRRSHS